MNAKVISPPTPERIEAANQSLRESVKRMEKAIQRLRKGKAQPFNGIKGLARLALAKGGR